MGQGQSGMPGQQPQGQGGQDKNKEGVSVLPALLCHTSKAYSSMMMTSLSVSASITSWHDCQVARSGRITGCVHLLTAVNG
jgi:hypothetical protein